MKRIQTPKEFIAELRHRAWQERAAAKIGRTSKARTERAEHAAHAMESLAADIEREESEVVVPAHLPLSTVDALEEQSIDARMAER